MTTGSNAKSMAEHRITPEMTVREINARYPVCGAVFAQHGMGGCGGDLGPDETLAFFAAAHRVELSGLLAELERAVEEGTVDTVTPALEFERGLAGLYKAFIRAAIAITLTFGTAWGAYILAKIAVGHSFDAPNYAGTQAHGHAQIYGWVGLFIMGVAYFSVPKLLQARMRTLATGWIVLALMLAGILLRAVAQPLAAQPAFGWLALASGGLELAAVLLFVGDLGLIFARSRQEKPSFVLFLHASLASLTVLAVWNLLLVVPLWRDHTTAIPEPANSRFLYLAVFGFIINMILGYSLRLLPVFLGLRPPRQKLILPAVVAFNAGVLARLVGADLLSGALLVVGTSLHVGALRLFEPRASYVKSRGVDASFPWFIGLAFSWFVIAALMVLSGDLYTALTGTAPAHFYTGAWRHALTVGFITTLMVGLGCRLLPMFSGVDLWWPRWMRISFWLLAVGNATRVIFQLATATGERWAFLVMGTSGLMELTALTLFGVGIWKTLARRQQVLFTSEQISPKTHVRWLLDNFPQAREELIRAGLHHLQQVRTVPWFITLEQAAGVHGVEVGAIVDRLRAVLRPATPAAPPKTVQITLDNQGRKAS